MRSALIAALVLAPSWAQAHATDQAFVLLLPTGVYSTIGVAVVVVTFLLVAWLPEPTARGWQHSRPIRTPGGADLLSMLSMAIVFALLLAGVTDTRDPLANPLPLMFWTVFWVLMLSLAGFLGDFWHWINPWTGIVHLLQRLGLRPVAQVPASALDAVAFASLFAFAGFLLADPAPADPGRLAVFGALYWFGTLLAALVFGVPWLQRAEVFAALFRWFGALSQFDWRTGRIGRPGWQVAAVRGPVIWCLLPLLMLGVGSFDGLNETFLWLAWLGINPLEFPGRSAVVLPNLIGLCVAVLLLFALFFSCVALGQILAGPAPGAALRLAPTVLPIALAYHVAHYLPGFLVEIQYVAGMLARFFGADPPVVTTGFFFTQGPVRLIWLTQGAAVVIGHAFAVFLSHVVALDLYQSRRRAVLSQLPLGVFMVAYTFFGLWLLAAPKGG